MLGRHDVVGGPGQFLTLGQSSEGPVVGESASASKDLRFLGVGSPAHSLGILLSSICCVLGVGLGTS